MTWIKKLLQLNDVLSDLVPDKDGITKYVIASGLKLQSIDFSSNAMDIWNNILSEANKSSKVNRLIKSVLDSYTDNLYLKSALTSNEIDFSTSPDIDDTSDWQDVSEETLELLTTEQNTLLPVNFW